MPEDFTPTIRLSIESLWGDRPTPSGEPGTMRLSPEEDAEIIRLLRSRAVRWLDFHWAAFGVVRHGAPQEDGTLLGGLDFDSPAQPTTDDIEGLLLHARRAVEMLEALHELAPTTFNDDDDDDPEPAPEPEPTSGASA